MTAIIIYMLYKKSSVWPNFVRSDKILNSVTPMCGKTLEYLDSTDVRFHYSFFMPPDRMIGGILFLSCLSVCLFVCLFVCLSVVNFNIRYNFWTVKDRDFIFGMHTCTPLMMPFQMTPTHQVQWPCDLDFDLCSKNSFFGLCCRQGHSPCFTNTPWFFFNAMYGNNVLHVRPYFVEDLTLIL